MGSDLRVLTIHTTVLQLAAQEFCDFDLRLPLLAAYSCLQPERPIVLYAPIVRVTQANNGCLGHRTHAGLEV